MEIQLERFVKAQEQCFEQAMAEIIAGKKQGHWMWYIFPQYKGLGFSEKSCFYAINSREEAMAYLAHPVLGSRLREISKQLLLADTSDPQILMGMPDDMKLKSCMTLFAVFEKEEENIFRLVLQKFFAGEADLLSLKLINE